MLLSEIFSEHSIKLNIEAETKEEVLMELIETIGNVHPELNKAEMFSVIQRRENKMNTAIASGVAVPHGYYPGTNTITGAIGISRNGIDYETIDNKPVYFVFLLLLGDSAREEHLRTLNRVLSLINSGALPSMQTAKNVREVHDILSRFR